MIHDTSSRFKSSGMLQPFVLPIAHRHDILEYYEKSFCTSNPISSLIWLPSVFTDIGNSIKCLGFFKSSLTLGVNSDKKCGVVEPS